MEQSRLLREKLHSAGAEVQLRVLKKAGHGFGGGLGGTQGKQADDAAVKFLDQALKQRRDATKRPR